MGVVIEESQVNSSSGHPSVSPHRSLHKFSATQFTRSWQGMEEWLPIVACVQPSIGFRV